MMDDSDIALEKAVRNLDIDDEESSDSEVEQGEELEQHGRVAAERAQTANCLSEERSGGLTRERMEHLYPPTEDHMYDVKAGDQLSQISEGCISTSSAVSSMVPITLAAVVSDDRLFLMFRRFLKDQCITRNLNFWLACEHYRTLSTDNREHLLDVAKAIYIKFIKNSAPQKVTIQADTKNRIKMSLDYKSEPLTVQLFDTAQQEIWEVMDRNEVLQFAVSESFAECSQFTGLTVPNTSYMANPAYGVRGAGSLQHSGSEDSASLSSFSTDSDAGPRSAVMGQLSRPRSTSARKALSDTEGSRQRRNPSQQQQTHSKLYATKDNPVTSEMFVALVTERLLAVEKDRKAMEQRVRDDARQVGRSFHDIMSLEWYDHPEARKYLLLEVVNSSSMTAPASSSASLAPQDADHLHQPHSVKHILSPHSPGATPRSSQDHGKKTLAHINSLAQQEVEHALKDYEITNQVNKKRRGYGGPLSTSSSVYSTYSDSGVGGDWATSGLVTPIHDHTQAYVKGQTMLNQTLPTRQKEAQAAAIALISNSPQPDMLNPHVQRSLHHHHGERQRRNHQFVRNYPGAYSSDDSSSCYTMTSQSSTSEALFVPRKATQSVYTESDDQPHFSHHPRYRGTRQLSQPKRSYKQQHPQSTPSPMAQSHRQQQQQQLSQSGGNRSGGGGDTLIVYHLDDFPTPFAKRLGGGNITLSDFKEKVFSRRGDFRFFFKYFCEDIQMEIMEEYSDDSAVLPLVQGKIIGRVEKTST